ncbi:unnamed protein product [Owenia fusiformis]|uniref:Ran GTPase activating protein 1 n=1 Tax=Owenia fusiformis TaxID=6347 RepID=A0A8S4N8L7_OWEFU|nr:unnamed protein product [Owenia fusiformis]
MSTSEIDNVTDQLSKTSVDAQNELNFAGRGMKLDKSEDAVEIVKGIEACSHMTALRLEGNTLGVDAASTIADALKKHPEFERALWKDMFTGRLKTEIPPALVSLGNAIMEAGAKLVELDLSDNAFGPIGVEGIAELLKSPSCYSLKELKLNNNGLGPRGGKLLAKTLMESYEKSVAAGTPLGLKVFVSGRGRLENEGSTALAEAFKAMGTLEEVSMPQNGINHAGITALADAFASNKNLKNINLNDNTFTEKGALSMAKALPHMQQLEVLNFGDCLVRTKGAAAIATSIKQTHKNLKEVNLGFNEIKKSGATAIAEALEGKPIETLDLDGNQFGEEGCELLRATLEAVDMLDALGSLSDDEGSEDEDEAGDDAEEDSDNEDNQDDEEGEIVEDPALQVQGKAISPSQQKQGGDNTEQNKITIDNDIAASLDKLKL